MLTDILEQRDQPPEKGRSRGTFMKKPGFTITIVPDLEWGVQRACWTMHFEVRGSPGRHMKKGVISGIPTDIFSTSAPPPKS